MLERNNYKQVDSHLIVQDKKSKKLKNMSSKKQKNITCNLCDKEFKPKSKFERFCFDCKIENEDYLDYEAYCGIS